MIDLGAVGSVTDLATLVVCVVGFYRVRDSQDAGHAVTTAVAERVTGIADDRARADLDVPERESDKYILDGGHADD